MHCFFGRRKPQVISPPENPSGLFDYWKAIKHEKVRWHKQSHETDLLEEEIHRFSLKNNNVDNATLKEQLLRLKIVAENWQDHRDPQKSIYHSKKSSLSKRTKAVEEIIAWVDKKLRTFQEINSTIPAHNEDHIVTQFVDLLPLTKETKIPTNNDDLSKLGEDISFDELSHALNVKITKIQNNSEDTPFNFPNYELEINNETIETNENNLFRALINKFSHKRLIKIYETIKERILLLKKIEHYGEPPREDSMLRFWWDKVSSLGPFTKAHDSTNRLKQAIKNFSTHTHIKRSKRLEILLREIQIWEYRHETLHTTRHERIKFLKDWVVSEIPVTIRLEEQAKKQNIDDYYEDIACQFVNWINLTKDIQKLELQNNIVIIPKEINLEKISIIFQYIKINDNELQADNALLTKIMEKVNRKIDALATEKIRKILLKTDFIKNHYEIIYGFAEAAKKHLPVNPLELNKFINELHPHLKKLLYNCLLELNNLDENEKNKQDIDQTVLNKLLETTKPPPQQQESIGSKLSHVTMSMYFFLFDIFDALDLDGLLSSFM